MLKTPTNQDLRGRAAILRGDLSDHGMLQALYSRSSFWNRKGWNST
jgi:hypothetical protein